jgi:hypothetical protein
VPQNLAAAAAAVVVPFTAEHHIQKFLTLIMCTPVASCCTCRLVGVARVPEVSEAFLDIFLMLPTDALAVMRATLEFS